MGYMLGGLSLPAMSRAVLPPHGDGMLAGGEPFTDLKEDANFAAFY
ncbi:hypothetical protein [Kingella potus]|nr:hypothetical protein [Kingella potus]